MDSKTIQRERREERRAAELRENLRRRKQQAKARISPSEPAGRPSPNSAGIASEKERD